MRSYRKPASPPPRRLGDGYHGPVIPVPAAPKEGSAHRMTPSEFEKARTNAAFAEARAWERNNPIEVYGCRFERPRISSQEQARRDAEKQRDNAWAAIRRTQRILKAIG